jgi:hypothetical protein
MITRSQFKTTISKLFSRICAGELTRTFSILVLLVIVWELGGIWIELRGVRSEQVKNAFYALPSKQMERLRSRSDRRVQNRLRLLASEIAGIEQHVNVDIDQPLDVEIGNQPLSVEIER